MSAADPFARIARTLVGTRLRRVRYAAVTDSTNDDVARILGDEDARGLTVVADYQRHGAGRKGRSWTAPSGAALLFTTALPDPVPTADLWCVPLWAALALQAALHACGVDAALQWPNDLLLGTKKLCGILCVSRVAGERAWAGCGVGVNVRRPAPGSAAAVELAAVDPPPAFCSDVAAVDRADLLASVLHAFDAMLPLLAMPQRIARRWEGAAGLPGAHYRVHVDGEPQPFDAVALRLTTGGGLEVRTSAGLREIALADARVLR